MLAYDEQAEFESRRKQAAQELRSLVEKASQYIHDPHPEQVTETYRIDNFRILMGLGTLIGNKSLLLTGRVGTGKTTFASVLSSLVTGLPYDVFDWLKIQGHPDQTKDTLLACVDMEDFSKVEWRPHLFLPSLTIDEVNRLLPGKQNTMLEYVRTGVVEHLGHIFTGPKPTFFATRNYDGVGTSPLTPPLLDRFDLSLWMRVYSALEDDEILEKSENLSKIADPKRTTHIQKVIADKRKSIDERLTFIKQEQDLALDLEGIRELVKRMPYDPMAKTLRGAIREESNFTYRFGENSAHEQQDTSDHNKNFLSRKISEGLSMRWSASMEFYASFLALATGAHEVQEQHILALAPHAMAHRVEFVDDYRAQFQTDGAERRDEPLELFLAKRAVAEVKDNLTNVYAEIKTMDAYFANIATGVRDRKFEKEVDSRLAAAAKGAEPDHPLLRAYHRGIRDATGRS